MFYYGLAYGKRYLYYYSFEGALNAYSKTEEVIYLYSLLVFAFSLLMVISSVAAYRIFKVFCLVLRYLIKPISLISFVAVSCLIN